MECRKKIESCMATCNAADALAVFRKMRDEELPLQLYMYQMLLNICSSCSSRSRRNSNSIALESETTIVEKNLEEDAFEVLNHMKVHLGPKTKKHPVDESCYSALVKLCSKQGHTDKACSVILELEAASVVPKLRTFSPLLLEYARLGDVAQAWSVYEKIKSHALDVTEVEYAGLLRATLTAKDAAMFYKVLEIFMDDILVPEKSTWDILQKWFTG
jgi:pentatricopeptide repeat protein